VIDYQLPQLSFLPHCRPVDHRAALLRRASASERIALGAQHFRRTKEKGARSKVTDSQRVLGSSRGAYTTSLLSFRAVSSSASAMIYHMQLSGLQNLVILPRTPPRGTVSRRSRRARCGQIPGLRFTAPSPIHTFHGLNVEVF